MGKKIVTLSVTKTGTYYMTVQLDESINLEDLDRIQFGDLVSKSTHDGEDTFEKTGYTPDRVGFFKDKWIY